MATIDWPPGLPALPNRDGYTGTFPDDTARSDIETGPALALERSTAGPDVIDVQLALSAAQVGILDNFHRDTTAGGALAFNWSPRLGTGAGDASFVTPPKYTTRGIARFTATFQIEVLP